MVRSIQCQIFTLLYPGPAKKNRAIDERNSRDGRKASLAGRDGRAGREAEEAIGEGAGGVEDLDRRSKKLYGGEFRKALAARKEPSPKGVHNQSPGPELSSVDGITLPGEGDVSGTESSEGRRLPTISGRCKKQPSADGLLAGRAGKLFRSSRRRVVWSMVRLGSHEHPDQQSGGLEEDHFYSDL